MDADSIPFNSLDTTKGNKNFVFNFWQILNNYKWNVPELHSYLNSDNE